MKARAIFIEIVSAALIILFIYTGGYKITSIDIFQAVLAQAPMVKHISWFIAYAVPLAELGVALCLIIPRLRLLGLYLSAIMMGVFMLYVVYMLAFVPHLPCQCGGVIKEMTWEQHVVFNGIFTILPILAIKLYKKRNTPIDNNKAQLSQAL